MANKKDLEPLVSTSALTSFANANAIDHCIEISAKDQAFVKKIFEAAVRDFLCA